MSKATDNPAGLALVKRCKAEFAGGGLRRAVRCQCGENHAGLHRAAYVANVNGYHGPALATWGWLNMAALPALVRRVHNPRHAEHLATCEGPNA